MNGLIYVDGVELPHVQTFSVGWYDVAKDSGRDTTTANGTMVLNIINNKYRLDITSIYMNQAQMQEFFSKIKIGSKFTVNFFNPYTGARKECKMYRGDRSVTLKYKIGSNTLYEPVTIALIEL